MANVRKQHLRLIEDEQVRVAQRGTRPEDGNLVDDVVPDGDVIDLWEAMGNHPPQAA